MDNIIEEHQRNNDVENEAINGGSTPIREGCTEAIEGHNFGSTSDAIEEDCTGFFKGHTSGSNSATIKESCSELSKGPTSRTEGYTKLAESFISSRQARGRLF